MTNAKMKAIMTKSGGSEEVVEKISEKFDFEKITELIDGASKPEEAIEAIHNFYPELEVSKLQEQLDFVHGQFESAYNEQKSKETFELTESELDHVAGGGISEWYNGLSQGWKAVVTTATLIVATTAIFAGVGALGAVMAQSALSATTIATSVGKVALISGALGAGLSTFFLGTADIAAAVNGKPLSTF